LTFRKGLRFLFEGQVALSSKEEDWAREQIATFGERRPGYQAFVTTLVEVLEKATKELAPRAIVDGRAKTISSFGEKIWRKRKESPVEEFTDLCGARVITHAAEEVEAVSRFIEEHFEIDRENSVDVRKRLEPTEFGYRSVHYIVSFKGPIFATPDGDVQVPDEVLRMPNARAEVQVRTILEHAWADMYHERAYKAAFKPPPEVERDLAGVAAVLEGADEDFSRIEDTIVRYQATYEAELEPAELETEIDKLRIVLDNDPGNAEVAGRIGKLEIGRGNWAAAIEVLSQAAGSGHQPVLRDLGVAICKKHGDTPDSDEYREGQRYLEQAVASPKRDVDSLASLAGTWKGIDDERAGEYYRQAFEVDPSDPYAAGNYIEHEIIRRADASFLRLLAPVIDAAIERCHEQAAVRMNLPWAHYDIGKFSLFRGRPYEALGAYAQALAVTPAPWMVVTSLRSLARLAVVRDDLPGYEWARRLLLLGLATGFADGTVNDKSEREAIEAARAELGELATGGADPIAGPVVIVAGGCDESVRAQIGGYADLLREAFRDFEGTIISGGTEEGIAGLVGDLRERSGGTVRALGYLPASIPEGEDATVDERYDEIRRTEGEGFSALEPLQNWIDLLASGIHPSEVKALGINGGTIAASEFRIALALGATVAVIEASGREASGLLADEQWSSAERLIRMPKQTETLRAYLASPLPTPAPKLPQEARDRLARAIHERYLENQRDRKPADDPAMAPWESLRDDLKESNRQQADFIVVLLAEIGCKVVEASDPGAGPPELTDARIEGWAEREHGRWNLERLRADWSWAPERDAEAKRTPDLVGWPDLPDEIREYDRETVRAIPDHLSAAGLAVVCGGET
jgi:ppGpp synthetase/RelA/SpoT-type nucleotidyltranferase